MSSLATPVVEASDLRKDYIGGDGNPIRVLAGVNLRVEPGEFVAIIGASGSGKSTLLHLLGALDVPTGGDVYLSGQRYGGLSPMELAALRNRQIGFVFQFHHLLRDFTALENVMMPLLIAGVPEHQAAARAREVLGSLGLRDRLLHRLVTRPVVLLADEPSGNLDPANAERLHGLLASVTRDHGRALVVVTHNRALADLADRVLALHEGVLALPRGDEVMAP